MWLILILLSDIASILEPNDFRNLPVSRMEADKGVCFICPGIRQLNQSVLLMKTQYFQLLVENQLAS